MGDGLFKNLFILDLKIETRRTREGVSSLLYFEIIIRQDKSI